MRVWFLRWLLVRIDAARAAPVRHLGDLAWMALLNGIAAVAIAFLVRQSDKAGLL